jgi:hypothetical protein
MIPQKSYSHIRREAKQAAIEALEGWPHQPIFEGASPQKSSQSPAEAVAQQFTISEKVLN